MLCKKCKQTINAVCNEEHVDTYSVWKIKRHSKQYWDKIVNYKTKKKKDFILNSLMHRTILIELVWNASTILVIE